MENKKNEGDNCLEIPKAPVFSDGKTPIKHDAPRPDYPAGTSPALTKDYSK